MPSTHYALNFKDKPKKEVSDICFAPLSRDIATHIKNGLTSISLYSENAKIYKHKEYMKYVKKAFPEGLIGDDGEVNLGFKADLFIFALCVLRQPTEYYYDDVIPDVIEVIKKQYSAIENPPFKLSAPLMVALMNFPGSASGEKIRPIQTANYNHAGVDWTVITWKDLYYLSNLEKFDGVQGILGQDQKSWKLGFASVALHEKRNGSYVGGSAGWRKDQDTVTIAFHPILKKLSGTAYDHHIDVNVAYKTLFELMIKNNPN